MKTKNSNIKENQSKYYIITLFETIFRFWYYSGIPNHYYIQTTFKQPEILI